MRDGQDKTLCNEAFEAQINLKCKGSFVLG